MTENRGKPVSRRGLLGVFGVGAKHFRDALEKEAQNLAPGAPPPPAPAPSYERLQRSSDETLTATSDGHGRHVVDLSPRPIAVGRSLRIVGEGLAEPLLAARVNASHVGVVAGECPVDGSDLMWLQFEDRVACPSCGSRWRLDGDVMRGPADSMLAAFFVEELDGKLCFRSM